MEFPTPLYVVMDADGTCWAGRGLTDLPEVLLNDGVEVAIYSRRRLKTVAVSRKLKALKGEPEDEGLPQVAEDVLPV